MSQTRLLSGVYRRRIFLAAIAAGLVIPVAAWSARPGDPTTESATNSRPASQDEIASAKSLSTAFRSAAGKVLPSVVAIETRETRAKVAQHGKLQEGNDPFDGQNPFAGTPFEDFFKDSPFNGHFREFHPMPEGEAVGMGSGFIIDSSGVILTNNHVVDGGGDVTVRLNDGRVFKAVDVKTDPKTDIAIVRIEGATDLVPAEFGNSDQVEVGDWVLALGQPFGLTSTVTAGIISARHRDIGINSRENFFQTDAAINPGNSGGPLVNLDGQVVGINTAISTRSGGNEGIGFAVPINVAHWVSDQLVRDGAVKRAYLGIGIQSVTPELASQFGVKPNEGVVVTQVLPDTPAAKMGIKSGDVIMSVDGTPVTTAQELQTLVEKTETGSNHKMSVLRDHKSLTLAFTPEAEPENYGIRTSGRNMFKGGAAEGIASLGIKLDDLTPEIAQQLDLKDTTGAVITGVDPGSIADEAGLRTGMVVAQVNRQDVHTAAETKTALEAAQLDKGVLLLLHTPSGSQFVVLQASTG